MYERFSDRARKVMQIAAEEAQKFKHGYVGTQHVLWALLIEGEGVGGRFLKQKVDPDLLRQVVDISIESKENIFLPPPLPHSPRVKRVIEESVNISREMNHGYVGTEHLLLAFFKVPDCVALECLKMYEITFDEVKKALDPEAMLNRSELLAVSACAVFMNAINSRPNIKSAVIELLKNSSYANVETTLFALAQVLREPEEENAPETPK